MAVIEIRAGGKLLYIHAATRFLAPGVTGLGEFQKCELNPL